MELVPGLKWLILVATLLLQGIYAAKITPGIPTTDVNAIRERIYLNASESALAVKNKQDVVAKLWILATLKAVTPAPQTEPPSTPTTTTPTTATTNTNTTATTTTTTTTSTTTTTTTTSTTTTTTTIGGVNGTNSSMGEDAGDSFDVDSMVANSFSASGQSVESSFCETSIQGLITTQFCSYILYGKDFSEFWENLRQKLIKKSEWQIEDYDIQTYSRIEENTVFQTFMMLDETKFMPQFKDLNNSATLKISDELILLTRPLMKNRFGEFFFRSVALSYSEDPLTTFVVANLAFLVEPNPRNFMDFYGAWINQRDGFGTLGTYRLKDDDFKTYRLSYIPKEFVPFLTLSDGQSREDLTLDTVENLTQVGIPSLVVLATIILLVVVCAWEGWCCKKLIENDQEKGCFGI